MGTSGGVQRNKWFLKIVKMYQIKTVLRNCIYFWEQLKQDKGKVSYSLQTCGWIGHAVELYRTERDQGKYTGYTSLLQKTCKIPRENTWAQNRYNKFSTKTLMSQFSWTCKTSQDLGLKYWRTLKNGQDLYSSKNFSTKSSRWY